MCSARRDSGRLTHSPATEYNQVEHQLCLRLGSIDQKYVFWIAGTDTSLTLQFLLEISAHARKTRTTYLPMLPRSVVLLELTLRKLIDNDLNKGRSTYVDSINMGYSSSFT